ncbi:GntR family transcriptional regulator [Actinacidiphila glaucinigra]|uniref:GntR family transcriptional regulator n=1 Tax=Actinacidiphila glaucinigra TaxID=235986 RepID=UPI003D8F7DC1
MSIELDSSGDRKFQRIVDVLRMEIADGKYPVGQRIPTQVVLGERFQVSRDTVQHALSKLEDEGLIEAKQGSGTVVVKRPDGQVRAGVEDGPGMVSLGPYMSMAFEAEHVTLDLFSLTAESMDDHLRSQALRVRDGLIRPRSITVRLLLPSVDVDLALPRTKGDPTDDRPKERLRELTQRHAAQLKKALMDLRSLRLVSEVSVKIKTVPLTPLGKLYLLNKREALHGFYQLVERPIELDGEEIAIYDVLGVGATLFRYQADDDPASRASIFVSKAQQWFDSLWEYLAQEATFGE